MKNKIDSKKGNLVCQLVSTTAYVAIALFIYFPRNIDDYLSGNAKLSLYLILVKIILDCFFIIVRPVAKVTYIGFKDIVAAVSGTYAILFLTQPPGHTTFLVGYAMQVVGLCLQIFAILCLNTSFSVASRG